MKWRLPKLPHNLRVEKHIKTHLRHSNYCNCSIKLCKAEYSLHKMLLKCNGKWSVKTAAKYDYVKRCCNGCPVVKGCPFLQSSSKAMRYEGTQY
uniref:Lipocalin/cytosolic fatty-acid binding domain-containing protein n=1 Tax=Parascaris univalens TaxID=6257 RepID=A0A915B2E2_PARUN